MISGRQMHEAAKSPFLGPLRSNAGKFIRWMHRSGHRTQLTAQLRSTLEAMSGVVVDVGGGRDSPLAAHWGNSVKRVRIDISAEFQPHIVADGAKLPLACDVADAVILSEVLEHVPDPQAMVDEVRRVLRPGGKLAGSVPFLCQGIHADPNDYYRYTEQALLHLLAAFDQPQVVPHGNGLGVAWRMVVSRFRLLAPLNPLLRQLSRATDPQTPEGYTFWAHKI